MTETHASVHRSLWSRVAKRTIDIVVGLHLCVLSAVLIIPLMVAALFSFRAAPLFAQHRVGRHHEHFRIFKIRSLPTTTHEYTDKYSLAAEHTTRFGRFIRRTHLDEIPQFWLVVAGRMSLVGPRPEMPHLHERFAPHQADARKHFRPGCTGLWQLSDHAGGLMFETPEYDLFYVQHQCVRLDVWILWRTIPFHIWNKSVSLSDVPRWVLA